jgi:hypothetical protein
MAGWAECSVLRPPGTRFGCGQRRRRAEDGRRPVPAFRSPFRFLGNSAIVTARFLGALGPGSVLREVADLKMVFRLTASRMVAADLFVAGHPAGGRRGMASAIDVGTVLL